MLGVGGSINSQDMYVWSDFRNASQSQKDKRYTKKQKCFLSLMVLSLYSSAILLRAGGSGYESVELLPKVLLVFVLLGQETWTQTPQLS